MSEALPALICGVINSVIALFGSPWLAIRSRTSTPVNRTVVGEGEGWGKRAASNFRRSTTLLADMPHFGTRREYVQVNIFNGGMTSRRPIIRQTWTEAVPPALVLLSALVFADERDHDALDF